MTNDIIVTSNPGFSLQILSHVYTTPMLYLGEKYEAKSRTQNLDLRIAVLGSILGSI